MTFLTVTPNSKGQITIPVDLRNKYGIKEGTQLLLVDKDGAIEIRKIKHIETDDVWDDQRRKKLFELARTLRGAWADDTGFERRTNQQRRLELAAAKRMRKAW